MLVLATTAQSQVTYTNSGTGNWSASGSWVAGKPSAGGAATATIQFSPSATDWSTNDLAGAFFLNHMTLTTAQAVTNVAVAGSSLVFTNNGVTKPAITNTSTGTLAINSPMTIATNLTVNLTAAGNVVLNGNISGSGNLINYNGANNSTFYLGGSNSYSSSTIFWGNGSGQGTMYLTSPNALPAGSTMILTNSPFSFSLDTTCPLISGHTLLIYNSSSRNYLSANTTATIFPIWDGNVICTNQLNTSANALAFNGSITLGVNNGLPTVNTTTTVNLVNPPGTVAANCGHIEVRSANPIINSRIIGAASSCTVQAGTTTPMMLNNPSNTFYCSVYNIAGGSGTGWLAIPNIASNGAVCALGSGSTNNGTVANSQQYLNFGYGANNGQLTINGTGGITDRQIIFTGSTGGATLDASASGLVQFANTGVITNSGAGSKTLTLQGNGTGELDGVIVDNSTDTYNTSLAKSGSGVWMLTGVNTYSGNTTVNAGLLVIGGAGSLGNGNYAGNLVNNGGFTYASSVAQTLSGAISDGGALTNSSSATLTLAGVISGSGVLANSGSGTLMLTGVNTNTGAIVIASGTLALGGAGQLGGGNYTKDLTDNGVFNYGSSALQTNRGDIVGSGALTVSGTGALTLLGTNTYAGPTTISAGQLVIGGAGNLGGGNYTNNLVVNGVFTFNGSVAQTISGNVSGNGTLTSTGSGLLTLAGTNTFSGNLAVDDGSALGLVWNAAVPTLKVASLTLGNSLGATNVFTLTAGSLAAPQIYATNLVLNGTSAISLAGGSFYAGQFPLIKYTTKSGLGTFATTPLSLPAQVSGYISNNVANNSIDLVVTAAPVYLSWRGNVNGNWDPSALNWLNTANSAAATFTTGSFVTLDDTATGTTTLNLTGALQPADVTAANTAKNYTLSGSGSLAGAMSLEMWGGGTLTIGTTNSYSGGTAIYGGMVALSGGGTLGGGALTLAGGALNLGGGNKTAGAVSLYSGALSGDTIANGSLTGTSYTANLAGDVAVVSANLLGSGSLLVTNGGVLILTGANSYTGTTTINGSAVLQIGNGGMTGTLGAGTISATNNGLQFNRTDSTSSPFVVNNTINRVGSAINLVVNSGAVQLGGSGDNNSNGADVQSGATLILAKSSASNIHAIGGNVTVENGGTLQLAGTGGDQIYDANSVTVNDGGVFDLNGRNETFTTLTIGQYGWETNAVGNFAMLLNRVAGTTSILTTSASCTIGDYIQMGGAGNLYLPGTVLARFRYFNPAPYGLTKVGSGTVTFGGTNTYLGTTAIVAGTLALTGGASISNSTVIALSAGATCDVSGLTAGTFNLSGLNTLTASGTGTSVGTTAAAIKGKPGGTVNLGSQPITLNYDGAHPALYVSQGTLVLSNNVFMVNTANGLPLPTGSYTLVQQASGSISSSGTFSVVGTAVGFERPASVTVSGGTVTLNVSPVAGWKIGLAGGLAFTNLTASFTAQPGYYYTVYASSNLATGPWTVIGQLGPYVVTNLQALSLPSIDPGFGSGKQRFYRLSGAYQPEIIPAQSSPAFPFQYYLGYNTNGLYVFSGDLDPNHYQPWYPPDTFGFDEKGRPYTRQGTVVWTINDANTGWETRDFGPQIYAAYPDWDGSLQGNSDDRILFDTNGYAYTWLATSTSHAIDQLANVELLLFSTNHCRTWSLYPFTLPYGQPNQWEADDANRNRALPPAMNVCTSSSGSATAIYYILNIVRTGTSLSPTLVPVPATTGTFPPLKPNVFSHGTKIFLVWGSTLQATNPITCQYQDTNGTACYAITFDRATTNFSAATFLGYGGYSIDSHCQPVITGTSDGRLQVVLGGHHMPYMTYLESANPEDTSSWTNIAAFSNGNGGSNAYGSGNTYPNLICDTNDQLYCVMRQSGPGYRFMLGLTMLNTRTNDAVWTPLQWLVQPARANYQQWSQSLAYNPVADSIYLNFSHYCFALAYNDYWAYINTWPQDGMENATIPPTTGGYDNNDSNYSQTHWPAVIRTADHGQNWRATSTLNFIKDIQP